MIDIAAGFLCVAGIAFMIWRTEQYLRGSPIGKRPNLSMSVRKGRIRYRSKS